MSKTVLVVEDESSIAVALEFLLQQQSYRTIVARNGEEAVTLAAQSKPDLILLDIMLPLLSGFEVCRRIRADNTMPRTRIVMLTAKGREGEVHKGFAVGADAYLMKPFSTKELLALVRKQLGD
jgi:two-component system alkaline phosphatase synthesis response regulator PhoP